VALEAFVYAERFRQGPGPVLWTALGLHAPLLLAAMAQGRWTPALRRADAALSVWVAAAVAWALLDGPVFTAAVSNEAMRLALLLTLVWIVGDFGWRWHRAKRWAPALRVE